MRLDKLFYFAIITGHTVELAEIENKLCQVLKRFFFFFSSQDEVIQKSQLHIFHVNCVVVLGGVSKQICVRQK